MVACRLWALERIRRPFIIAVIMPAGSSDAGNPIAGGGIARPFSREGVSTASPFDCRPAACSDQGKLSSGDGSNGVETSNPLYTRGLAWSDLRILQATEAGKSGEAWRNRLIYVQGRIG
jgi:hypothetical protein